ncbi:protein kinase, putative [Trypanosoma cruzi marinkellei]|uniref:Protein kinase, putative n=1 Tax=Trypanosoma cruzi marinkellei TaxID=85056 RepID=K2N1T7_TRYCR|nr:protein kinase, putative [Trypanosoma cruzi marinkellei]
MTEEVPVYCSPQDGIEESRGRFSGRVFSHRPSELCGSIFNRGELPMKLPADEVSKSTKRESLSEKITGSAASFPREKMADKQRLEPRQRPTSSEDRPPSWIDGYKSNLDNSLLNIGEWSQSEGPALPGPALPQEQDLNVGGEKDFETKPRAKFCTVGLRALVITHVLLSVAFVAAICVVPVETTRKSLDLSIQFLTDFSSEMVANEIGSRFKFLSETVGSVFHSLQFNQTTPLRPWSGTDMPMVMRQLCAVLASSAFSERLLYLHLSSPFSGFGAYCSRQYDGETIVGKHVAENVSEYRYLVDPGTLEYAQPLKPFYDVSRMTEKENSIDFASHSNPFVKIAVQWAKRNDTRRWWVYSSFNETMVTYTYPFIDKYGNVAAITGALQLNKLQPHYPKNYQSSDIASLVIVELGTGLVLSRIPGNSIPTMWDNWNCTAKKSMCGRPGVQNPYIWNTGSPYMRAAINKMGGKEGILMLLLRSNYSKQIFVYKGVRLEVNVNRVFFEDDQVFVASIIIVPKSLLTGMMEKTRDEVVWVLATAAFVVAVLEIWLASCLMRPIRSILKGLELMLQLREGSEPMKGFTFIKELILIQSYFQTLNKRIIYMKTFLPHGVMDQGQFNSPDSDSMGSLKGESGNHLALPSTEGKGGPLASSTCSSLSLKAVVSEKSNFASKEIVLKDGVNPFFRRYCSVVCLSLPLFDDYDSIGTVLQEYLEVCFLLLIRRGGVVEIQRPDFLLVTFGAHSNMPRNQLQAVRFVIELMQSLSPEILRLLAAVVDAGEYYVGTCGAANLNARVTYGAELLFQAELVRIVRCLGCHLLVTWPVAVSLGEQFLTIPVDTAFCEFSNRSVILYELRGHVTSMEPMQFSELKETARLIRHGFASMLKGEYEAAARIFLSVDKNEVQAYRLLQICRRFIRKGITKPYLRCVGKMRAPPYYLKANNAKSGRATSPDYNTYSKAFMSTLLGNDNVLSSLRMKRDLLRGNEEVGSHLLSTASVREGSVSKYSTSMENNVDTTAEEKCEEGLFEMFLESSEDEDEEQISLRVQSEGGRGGMPLSPRSIAKGELPFVFTDYRGNTWTRSADKLGVGAFSVVYRGMSTSGDLVALKCFALRARNIDIEDILEEIKLFSQFRHENIVQYISGYFSNDFFIEVMELVPGGSLDSILSSFGSLPTMAVRRFLRDALNGLMYLHSMNVVHCDVKPHNVLVAMDGVCKLSDFGSSLVRLTNSIHKISDVVEMRGTPGYIAPEVARGEVPSGKSDVFSLGITVLELLTGRLPWKFVQPWKGKELAVGGLDSAAHCMAEKRVFDGSGTVSESNVSECSAWLPKPHGCIGAALAEVSTADADWSNVAQNSVDSLLGSPSQLLIGITKGEIVPEIPLWLEGDVRDFLEACVAFDPASRPTVAELLNHPWML